MANSADFAMALNVLVLVCLIVVLGLLFYNTSQAFDANRNAALTRELAQELRQSSDDLTRFIRTYTVTGNHSFWNYFLEVLNIRDGISELPREPWRNWWDLYIADGVEPRPRGPPSSINDRFRAAGFTAAELAHLEEAKRQSDALVDVEDCASHAMVGLYRDAPPGAQGLTPAVKNNFTINGTINQTWAMQLVHSNFYHHWKGQIMRPLDEFTKLAVQRVDDKLNNIAVLNQVLLGILGAAVGILVIIMLLYIFKLRKDQETSQLLSAVLPPQISAMVTVDAVNKMRVQASEQARQIRRENLAAKRAAKKGANNNLTSPGDNSLGLTDVVVPTSPHQNQQQRAAGGFPVLYHEFIPMTWISFFDLVGFTRISRYTTSGQLIAILNELFSLTDAACTRFRIIKLKTIGDCVMTIKPCSRIKTDSDARGGTTTFDGRGLASPNANNNNNKNSLTSKKMRYVASCGHDMVRFLFHSMELAATILLPFDDVAIQEDDPEQQEPLPRDLTLRAGLHVGSVSAGVTGTDKFQFDVFGSEVNLAARLETSGVPSQIHMMQTTADLLMANFGDALEWDLAPRIVKLKGIGDAETRLLLAVNQVDGDDGDENSSSRRSGTGDGGSSIGKSSSQSQSLRKSSSSAVTTTGSKIDLGKASKPHQIYVQTATATPTNGENSEDDGGQVS